MSFRYHQMTTSQWGFSKGFGWSSLDLSLALTAYMLTFDGPVDNTTPFGPCIVSTKAIPNPQALPLKTTLNGETMQDGNTSYALFIYLESLPAPG